MYQYLQKTALPSSAQLPLLVMLFIFSMDKGAAKMSRFVTFKAVANQEPPYDLTPKSNFLLKSLGLCVGVFTSPNMSATTRVPSTTQ